jgi:hypothetical protein
LEAEALQYWCASQALRTPSMTDAAQPVEAAVAQLVALALGSSDLRIQWLAIGTLWSASNARHATPSSSAALAGLANVQSLLRDTS